MEEKRYRMNREVRENKWSDKEERRKRGNRWNKEGDRTWKGKRWRSRTKIRRGSGEIRGEY